MISRQRLALAASLLSVGIAGACATTSDDTLVYGRDSGAGRDAGHDAGPAQPTGGDAGNRSVGDAGTLGNDSGRGHDAAPDGSHDADVSDDVSHPISDGGARDHAVRDGGQVPVVYGQTASVLYSLNPDTKAVTFVGFFIGCDSDVIDIALNADSVMYATTADSVYTINTTNAFCTLLATGAVYPNSLSFVPAGTALPNTEALVGYQGSTYVQIDTTTGALSNIGALGGAYMSSGDIVSVIGGGTYLTVTGGSDCSVNDCLVEVNPSTGAIITNYGSVNHAEVYGLAFWAGDVYGFDNAGDLFEIGFTDGGPLGVTTILIPNPPLGGLSFNGAGSTTKAPVR